MQLTPLHNKRPTQTLHVNIWSAGVEI
jgi:hypothetical protein